MNSRRGDRAEAHAERHLRRRGLRLIERNFRTPRGEIDLIMRDGNELVFVEVRRRKHTRFGGAAASIGATKQRRLIAAAQQFLQRYGQAPARFDVMAFDADSEPQWIRDAFRSD